MIRNNDGKGLAPKTAAMVMIQYALSLIVEGDWSSYGFPIQTDKLTAKEQAAIRYQLTKELVRFEKRYDSRLF